MQQWKRKLPALLLLVAILFYYAWTNGSFGGAISAPEIAASAVASSVATPQSTTPHESMPNDKTALSDASNETQAAPPKDGSYTSKDDVALYLLTYGHLPSNFITKKQAEALGWEGGSLEHYAPGKSIGGSHFGNYEGTLPTRKGRSYTECDIDTGGSKKRGAKRLVFSNDGLIYYTSDHYETFTLLYGGE